MIRQRRAAADVENGITRRQFMLGSLMLVMLGRESAAEVPVDGEDMELCLLRCSGVLSFSEAWKHDISGGEGGWTTKTTTDLEREKAESDYLEGLAEGDVLLIGRVDSSEKRASGVGDSGQSSLSRLSFSEEGQMELLKSVMAEASYGTDMYATVLHVFSPPGIGWHRSVWLSIHARAMPENADRLKCIASSRYAMARRAEYESDVETYRMVHALDS